eukprot:1707752-Pleurochrysis_carterae.AAC.3
MAHTEFDSYNRARYARFGGRVLKLSTFSPVRSANHTLQAQANFATSSRFAPACARTHTHRWTDRKCFCKRCWARRESQNLASKDMLVCRVGVDGVYAHSLSHICKGIHSLSEKPGLSKVVAAVQRGTPFVNTTKRYHLYRSGRWSKTGSCIAVSGHLR